MKQNDIVLNFLVCCVLGLAFISFYSKKKEEGFMNYGVYPKSHIGGMLNDTYNDTDNITANSNTYKDQYELYPEDTRNIQDKLKETNNIKNRPHPNIGNSLIPLMSGAFYKSKIVKTIRPPKMPDIHCKKRVNYYCSKPLTYER